MLTFGSGQGDLEELLHLSPAQDPFAHDALKKDAVLISVPGSHLEKPGKQGVIDGHRCFK